MLKQIEGSRAVAETVAMCRPQVICAYPVTPQTHIVEALGAMVKKGGPAVHERGRLQRRRAQAAGRDDGR
jgi:pyruvate/2-oxoacid:ferredoxin oxidoreductase alpha subunit